VLTRGVKLISLTTACQTTEFSVTAADNKLFVQFQGNTTTLLFIILNCVITKFNPQSDLPSTQPVNQLLQIAVLMWVESQHDIKFQIAAMKASRYRCFTG
jgi:hypothetical protein